MGIILDIEKDGTDPQQVVSLLTSVAIPMRRCRNGAGKVQNMYRRIALILALSVLTGCALWSSPQRVSIERALRAQDGLAQATVRATHDLPDGAVLMYVTVGGQDGTLPTLECDAYAYREAGVWVVQTRGCGGRGANVPQGSFEVSASGVTQFGAVDNPISYNMTYGLVTDPAISQVTVTFADVEQHSVPHNTGAYLVVIQSDSPGRCIEAKDAAGKVLYKRSVH